MSDKQLYRQPVVLNSETHKAIKVAPVKDYGFAAEMNSSIVVCQEFLEAAKYYPIVFSNTKDVITPVALLGISSNLSVDSVGTWQEDTYIPAFIRRYPYILAEGLAGDGSLSVCVDSEYAGFDAKDGVRLFTDDGKNTPALDKAIEFMRTYHNQFEITKAFVSQIRDLNIFRAVDANISLTGGKKFTIKNLSMIDEQALLKLSDEQLIKLVRSGALAWIYAHLYSLTNFSKIVTRAGK
ncbi:MAG: SapC family protein [Nitrospirota bacterium]|nr:SapC family protein [Nitrospirota bacterium]